jgi:hypothetical protein
MNRSGKGRIDKGTSLPIARSAPSPAPSRGMVAQTESERLSTRPFVESMGTPTWSLGARLVLSRGVYGHTLIS